MALKDMPPLMRWLAPNVRKLAARHDVKGLRKAMHFRPSFASFLCGEWIQEMSEIRQSAADALATFPEGVTVLLDDLNDPRDGHHAMQALATVSDVRAVPALRKLLSTHPGSDLGKLAAGMLQAMGWQPEHDEASATYCIATRQYERCQEVGNAAIAPLVACLRDEKVDARRVAEALTKLGWQPARDEVGARYWLALGRHDQCVAIGQPSIPLLVEAMRKSRDPEAARALAELRWQPAGSDLAARFYLLNGQSDKLLALGDAGVRELVEHYHGRELLKARAEAGHIPPLLAILSDSRESLRRDAVETLLGIYKRPGLDSSVRSMILSARGAIERGHDDRHEDRHSASDCNDHGDRHQDAGPRL